LWNSDVRPVLGNGFSLRMVRAIFIGDDHASAGMICDFEHYVAHGPHDFVSKVGKKQFP
jgi:hypothetical protein